MSLSPNSRLVQRTIELNYTNKKRSTSLKWIIVNAVFLLIFVYDLSCKCPGYTSLLHYAELGCAAVLAANLLQYAVRLAPSRAPRLPLSPAQQALLGLSGADLGECRSCKCPGYTPLLHYAELGCAAVLAANLLQYAVRLAPSRAPRLPLSPAQQALLGLSGADLDSSFILTEHNSDRLSDSGECSGESDELTLWPRRVAARTPPPPAAHTPPRSPPRHASASALTPNAMTPTALTPTALTPTAQAAAALAADADSLAEYLERCAASGGPAPLYQLAAVDAGGGKLAGEDSSPPGAPAAWWRLELDPARLTQWNLNLRLWIHITILERLMRELRAADDALARLALCEAGALRGGRVPPARLRALAAHVPALAALAPFLEPFPDQRHALRRLGELAQGGCLSAYRWDAGEPPDAELLLTLVATYLDGQLPGGEGARPFSERYLAEGAPAGRRLAIARLGARPPHFGLVWRGALLGVPRGRNNLLHTLLLFLAAAARGDPPALARTHLGRAGLNMLWIIGR